MQVGKRTDYGPDVLGADEAGIEASEENVGDDEQLAATKDLRKGCPKEGPLHIHVISGSPSS
jgi:hypothetical protein